jgi:hypothetical protein
MEKFKIEYKIYSNPIKDIKGNIKAGRKNNYDFEIIINNLIHQKLMIYLNLYLQ